MNASATSISEQAAGMGSAWWQWLVRPDPFADVWECAYENYAIFIVLFTGKHPTAAYTHTPTHSHTHTPMHPYQRIFVPARKL